MGNSKIRFQKPFMLALLCFAGVIVLVYFSFFGHSLRSNSKYSSSYGDSFLANYGKIEASTFIHHKSNDKLTSYNSTYPLTAPGMQLFINDVINVVPVKILYKCFTGSTCNIQTLPSLTFPNHVRGLSHIVCTLP